MPQIRPTRSPQVHPPAPMLPHLHCVHNNGSDISTSPSCRGADFGCQLPVHQPHGISVSIPTWEDYLHYANHTPRRISKVKSAYPRSKVHYFIEHLADTCKILLGRSLDERCQLYPSLRDAEACLAYLETNAPTSPEQSKLVKHIIHVPVSINASQALSYIELYVVFFPTSLAYPAKLFWQYTGIGMSSRMAEYCLSILLHDSEISCGVGSQTVPQTAWDTTCPAPALTSKSKHASKSTICNDRDDTVMLKEAIPPYHVLDLDGAAEAKQTVRQRIANLVVEDPSIETSARVAQRLVTGDDIILFPTGMAAIWHSHLAIVECFPESKSVSFGFLYLDTLKVLESWGPGTHLFKDGGEHEVDELIELLRTSRDAGTPIRALWCEFPSNPLLRSPPLARLRELADEYDFLIAIDDTLGAFDNVDVLHFADIILTSLSKVFTGTGTVLGGSLILNPKSKYYELIKASVEARYEGYYWCQDVVQLEFTSRDVTERTLQMNKTTEVLVDFLRSRSKSVQGQETGENLVINEVYYPKWVTRDRYDVCRRGSPQHAVRSGSGGVPSKREGGYSMVFSISFISDFASATFFDTLDVAKGPSLGTNFTLACLYTLLAHPFELELAGEYGLERGLVRVSVGLEDADMLLSLFKDALTKTENAVLVEAQPLDT